MTVGRLGDKQAGSTLMVDSALGGNHGSKSGAIESLAPNGSSSENGERLGAGRTSSGSSFSVANLVRSSLEEDGFLRGSSGEGEVQRSG